jgi:hypothetical protein
MPRVGSNLLPQCSSGRRQFMPQTARPTCSNKFILPLLNRNVGRAIAEAVSRWLPTAAARVQSRVWSSGICGGQSGAGAGFLRVLRFPLPFIPPNSPSSQSPGAGTIGQ